jgi:glutamate dehydrogenase/leucine dehydrogenase
LSALELVAELGHEELVFVHDRASGLRAVIAIHDTTLGPAVGGTRMRLYPSLDDAAADALRLARAMTYKAVMAGVERGGGKAVILGDPARDKSRALLAAYARAVDRLGGRFQTGCDMGIDGRDIAVLSRLTKHVSHTTPGSSLETAGLAALGVFESIRAVAALLERELAGLHVAVQGLGQVGYRLARQLAAAGARLTVADVDEGRVERARAELAAAAVDAGSIYDVEADVFSPNAAGGVVNDATLPRLRCRAVVGGANEQLEQARHGDALHARGIVYAPDYVVNAGGLLSLLFEIGELDEAGVVARVQGIGGRLAALLAEARERGEAPHRAADRIAEQRLAQARARGSDAKRESAQR